MESYQETIHSCKNEILNKIVLTAKNEFKNNEYISNILFLNEEDINKFDYIKIGNNKYKILSDTILINKPVENINTFSLYYKNFYLNNNEKKIDYVKGWYYPTKDYENTGEYFQMPKENFEEELVNNNCKKEYTDGCIRDDVYPYEYEYESYKKFYNYTEYYKYQVETPKIMIFVNFPIKNNITTESYNILDINKINLYHFT